jgi:hypothetical protein
MLARHLLARELLALSSSIVRGTSVYGEAYRLRRASKQIAVLSEGGKEAGGHEVTWNASGTREEGCLTR